MRRIIVACLKIAISAALLYFALRTTDFAALTKRLNAGSLAWLALAGFVIMLQIALAAIRWNLLADLCGAPLSVATAFRFNMIGTFFNQTLPSSIGGDAVRLWLVGRRAGWRAATYSIFIDRAIGLIALALLILVCLPWSMALIGDSHARLALVTLDAVALGAGAVFLLSGALPAPWLDRWPPTHHIRRCAVIAAQVLIDPRRGIAIVILSMAIHMLNAVTAWCAASAIAAPVNFFQLFLLLPPVALITLLPVSIAGWGLRETAMGAAFASAGLAASEGINVSLVYGAIGFLMGGLGGLVWILSAEKAEKGEKQIDVPALLDSKL
jgi:uncharacterized membrane protein YbhN (UPF0104 family)